MGFVERKADKIVADLREQVNTDLCDSKLTLKHSASGETYHHVQVHGCVLSSVSTVVASAYREWLHSPQGPDRKFLMALKLPQSLNKTLCVGAVQILVAFLYGGAVEITEGNAATVLKLAQTFQIQDLTDACLGALSSNVSTSVVANVSTGVSTGVSTSVISNASTGISTIVSTNGRRLHTNDGSDQELPNKDMDSKSEASESSLCKSKNLSSQVSWSVMSIKNETDENDPFNSPAEPSDTTLLSPTSGKSHAAINQSIVDGSDQGISTVNAPGILIQGKKSASCRTFKGPKKMEKKKGYMFGTLELKKQYKGDTVQVTALPISQDQQFQYSDGSGGISVEIPQRRENGKRVFFCNICGKVGNFKQSLQNHVIREHTEVRVLCPHCNHQYVNEYYLTSHIRLYHSKTPYKQFLCELCGYKTIHTYQMNIHNRKFHGAAAFYCSHPGCHHKAYTKNRLKEHLRTHGARKFLCSRCGSAFKTVEQMQRHLLTHDKPFTCPLCDFRNAREYRLKAHMLKHHPEHS